MVNKHARKFLYFTITILILTLQVQDLFIGKSDIKCFMQYCCPWLLPPLILNGDNAGLDWVSKVNYPNVSMYKFWMVLPQQNFFFFVYQ